MGNSVQYLALGPPVAAGKFWGIFNSEIMISKGKSVETRIFLVAPQAR